MRLLTLLFLFSTNSIAETVVDIIALHRTGAQISDLKGQDYNGYGLKIRKNSQETFISGDFFTLKSQKSESVGLNFEFGFNQLNYNLSLAYMAEDVKDSWPNNARATCTKNCFTEWENTNYREHWYVKYEHKYNFITPILELRYVQQDKKKHVTSHIAYGVSLLIPYTRNHLSIKAMDRQGNYTIELSYQF